MKADKDLNSQQEHLSSTSYDLRITNLARFIYRKITFCHPEFISGSKKKTPKQVRHDDTSPLDSQDKRFLDVGAGNGLFLKFFKAKGFKVAGFELEKQNVQNMKRDPILTHENITQGDITKLTGKQEYDVVMASDVIEHIRDDVLAIKNLWSFVKPDGLMIITVPAHSFLYGKRDEKWGHYRRYDMKVLLEKIENAICSSVIPDLDRESMDPRIREDDSVGYHVVFATQWNIVGFYLYFLFEKILHKPINENMRYSNSLLSRSIRTILDKILRLEEMLGGVPLGLTLVVGVRKVCQS